MLLCRDAKPNGLTQVPDLRCESRPTHDPSKPLTPAQLAPCAISQQDFETAVKKVQPSVRREGFATTPDVTWSDVGSLAEVCTCNTAVVMHCCTHLLLQFMAAHTPSLDPGLQDQSFLHL